MRIGELAARANVNPKTIRYYESIGLLPDPLRTAAGYRIYAEEDIDRLAFVRRAQQLQLALDEIGEILALRERGERPCGYVLQVARDRLRDLDRRIAEMQRARDELHTLLGQAADVATDDGRYCQLIEHRSDAPPADERRSKAAGGH